jgi:putative oxidoreductase
MIRTAARALTGSTYAILGLDAALQPASRVEQASELLARIRTVVPLPDDDETIVRASGMLMTVAGTALAAGLAPRLSALVLAGLLAPTTMAGHAFWKIEDPAARKAQRVQFHKNLAMIGGLLFAVLDKPQRTRAGG